MMRPETTKALLDLNRRFYNDFGAAFAATRRRLQPGVLRVLAGIRDGGIWLDLGCGGGALGLAWSRQFNSGAYSGLDSSRVLLEHAQQQGLESSSLSPTIRFSLADLADPHWVNQAPLPPIDGVLAFAVLHHLPSSDLRRRVLQQVRELLLPGSTFIHSEWQFQHSPRLLKRVQPWSHVGISETDLEAGDTLLDWRYQLPGGGASSGFRYVHRFDREELRLLANDLGFSIVEEFESDGSNNRLALYQSWRAV